MKKRIGIIDVGIGNVGSLANMLRKVGNDAVIVSDFKELDFFTKVILPGVGRFDKGMEALYQYGFVEELRRFAQRPDTLILGVCLGMQMLFEGSEEGNANGLGLIPGVVERFKLDSKLPIPHVGWSETKTTHAHPLFKDMEAAYFYFVHAYHAPVNLLETNFTVATSEYGYRFPSVVGTDAVLGVQFHPEKSLSYGQKLFSNFIQLTREKTYTPATTA